MADAQIRRMIDNNNNSATLTPLIARLRENAGAILVRLVYNLPKDVPAKIKKQCCTKPWL
jgi:hypothetical protein